MRVGVDTLLTIYLLTLVGGAVAAVALAIWGQRSAWRRMPLAPATVAAAVTCFGGAGVLALHLFEFGVGRSTLAAALFAALSAALFGALARLARRAAERREALADLVGGLASVVVAIEPGHAGAVAPRPPHEERPLAAVSRHDAPLPVGATVVVTGFSGGLGGEAVEVAPLPAEGGLAEVTG